MAYGKTASQVGDWKGYMYVASLAVDGDIGPDVGSGSCSHPATHSGQPAWWSLHLGDVYQINNIVFSARDGYYS